jgi:hypothetical protein
MKLMIDGVWQGDVGSPQSKVVGQTIATPYLPEQPLWVKGGSAGCPTGASAVPADS